MSRYFLKYFRKEVAAVSGKLFGIDRIAEPARNRTSNVDFDELATDRFPRKEIVRDEAA
jgi:hypothetical protein